jgi:hypothetical protein
VSRRVAWRRRCRYEWAQQQSIAQRAGVTDEEIAQLRADVGTATWPGTVPLLIRPADDFDALYPARQQPQRET